MPIYTERVPSRHEWCPECEAYMPWGHRHPASGGRGGGGRGRPPTSTAFPRDDDEDPERSFLMAAIQEILDYDGWSSVRKIREIEKLIGRTRPGRR